jgi:hypothetical protein
MRAKDGAQPPVSPTRTQLEKTSACPPGAAQHGRTPPPQPAIKRKMWKKEKTGRRPEKTICTPIHSIRQQEPAVAKPTCAQTDMRPNRPSTCTSKHRHAAQPDSSTQSQPLQLGPAHRNSSDATLHLLRYYRFEKISRVQELLELHHYMNIQEP